LGRRTADAEDDPDRAERIAQAIVEPESPRYALVTLAKLHAGG